MGVLMLVIALSFVVIVLLVVGYSLFVSPFGRHTDHYRDTRTGKRLFDPPNLEDGHY